MFLTGTRIHCFTSHDDYSSIVGVVVGVFSSFFTNHLVCIVLKSLGMHHIDLKMKSGVLRILGFIINQIYSRFSATYPSYTRKTTLRRTRFSKRAPTPTLPDSLCQHPFSRDRCIPFLYLSWVSPSHFSTSEQLFAYNWSISTNSQSQVQSRRSYSDQSLPSVLQGSRVQPKCQTFQWKHCDTTLEALAYLRMIIPVNYVCYVPRRVRHQTSKRHGADFAPSPSSLGEKSRFKKLRAATNTRKSFYAPLPDLVFST